MTFQSGGVATRRRGPPPQNKTCVARQVFDSNARRCDGDSNPVWVSHYYSPASASKGGCGGGGGDVGGGGGGRGAVGGWLGAEEERTNFLNISLCWLVWDSVVSVSVSVVRVPRNMLLINVLL